MRISDWSSDVCSSDLEAARATTRRGWRFDRESPAVARIARRPVLLDRHAFLAPARCGPQPGQSARPQQPLVADAGDEVRPPARDACRQRSEEHTSELQSLMRTSYAVFCLKKKHQTTNRITQI